VPRAISTWEAIIQPWARRRERLHLRLEIEAVALCHHHSVVRRCAILNAGAYVVEVAPLSDLLLSRADPTSLWAIKHNAHAVPRSVTLRRDASPSFVTPPSHTALFVCRCRNGFTSMRAARD
jgi:hypothetical protein